MAAAAEPAGRRRFRPRLWSTVAAALALLVLLGLGVWQVERLAWKTALVDRINQRMAEPAVDLPAAIDDPATWDYRRVRLIGRFLNSAELRLAGRINQGRPGSHVVTPFEPAGGGPAVLVDRGWVPDDKVDPASRPESLIEGPTTVEGVARLPISPGWFTPANAPERNLWLSFDLPAMAAAAGLAGVQPLVVDAAASADPAALPIGGQTVIALRNDHLQYALTWFSLAVVLVVIYVLFHLDRPVAPALPPRPDLPT